VPPSISIPLNLDSASDVRQKLTPATERVESETNIDHAVPQKSLILRGTILIRR
jgi:hypothetical protein